MTSATITNKFLESVWVAVSARLTMLSMPFVIAFITWLTHQVYSGIQLSIERQSHQITEMQQELQKHQFELDSGKDFKTSTLEQFNKFDTQLSSISDKITGVSDTVIRVQTIVETRLPAKEGKLKWPEQ